jgi:hypothetical protein
MPSERIILHGPFRERRRTSKRGKVSKRVTIEIESTPLVHDFDETRLGQEVAVAIRDELSRQIKSINRTVSLATQARRQRDLDSPNTPSYAKRYKAPRTKAGTIRKGSVDSDPSPANISKWGYFSGRLADGLSVRQSVSDKAFTINVPANRLDEDSFGSGFLAFLQILEAEVPGFRDAAKLMDAREVRTAINHSINEMITSSTAAGAEKIRALRAKRAQLLLRGGSAIVRSLIS